MKDYIRLAFCALFIALLAYGVGYKQGSKSRVVFHSTSTSATTCSTIVSAEPQETCWQFTVPRQPPAAAPTSECPGLKACIEPKQLNPANKFSIPKLSAPKLEMKDCPQPLTEPCIVRHMF